MIGYVFLSVGALGTAVVAYHLAPAGRGAHRYVVPRAVLRAEAARSTAAADELACKLIGLASELDATTVERNDFKAALEKADLRIAELEEQVCDRDQLREANTALKAALNNAHAIRPLVPGPSPADDASALPDEMQEFANQTATAWRASA
ncbi:hypothetical protein [Streptomyces sp. NBC_00996]|uniref:hypothetical protein n=1 Tax=Streptomyces sp. NBC_00996 TaxID=2903710 RepID=UPI00386E54EE|nr:hypothetical protein OG390_17440 [Streptomyces sp. NBC_00996]